MKPLRHKKTCEVTKDLSGQERILQMTEEEDVYSDEGSVDSASVRHKIFLDCGCDSSVGAGGRCYECGNINCKSCFGHCQKCQKPLCMQHSNFLKLAGREIRLCGHCYNNVTREQKADKIKRFFLSLVLKYEE